MKQRGKDKRVTASPISLGQFLIIFISVLFTCGNYHIFYIRHAENQGGTPDIVAGIVLILFFSFLGSVLIGFIKTAYFDKPLRTLAEAAKKLSDGDFSVRIPHRKEKGKKDQVDVLVEDFNKMAEELGTIETLKTDFIANVSHEIKTPLAVIQSYAVAIQDDELGAEERREYGKTIVEASKKLTELVTNILKLNKLENQEIVPLAEAYSLDEQLRECVLNYEELWEKKGITLIGDDIADAIINCDRALLEIVWNNLLSNAIKFTPSGGTIMISLKQDGEVAVVTVSDTGCGMNAETAEHIFDRFYQGDTSHSAEGNGLGLALVKKVVNLLDGQILVDSEISKGTEFTVKLKI
jgi:signal transduction histidine kinase